MIHSLPPRPRPSFAGILDASGDSVGAGLDPRGGARDGVTDWFTRSPRRRSQGVTQPAARGAGDAAHRPRQATNRVSDRGSDEPERAADPARFIVLVDRHGCRKSLFFRRFFEDNLSNHFLGRWKIYRCNTEERNFLFKKIGDIFAGRRNFVWLPL